jgi:hypothetical protein
MKNSILVVISCLVFSACISDITDTVDKVQNTKSIQWNPTIAVPLVYSRLALRDLLDEAGDIDFLKVESDGSLKLVYSDEYISQTAEEAIDLEDQSYGETFTLSASELAALNSSGTVTVTYERELTYISGPNETDRITFKAGDLEMGLTSTLDHEIDFIFRILDATQNGNVFEPTLNSSSFPHNATQRLDIAGLDIDCTQGTLGHSQIRVEIEMTITKGGGAVKPVETISYTAELENQQFQFMQGFFDTQNFSSASSSLDLAFFENSTGGSFTLADPRIQMIFSNSLGFPVQASVVQFDGTNSDNNTVGLTGLPDPLPVPILSLSEVGQVKVDSFSLNKGNSNLADFINNRPSDIAYEVSVTSPSGSAGRQWVLDTSKLGVKINVEVPFEGTARDFSIESTESFNLELESTQELKEVLMRLYTENGFPIDVATQVYFEDSVGNVLIDSLFDSDNLILPAGQLDGSGRVISANPKTIDITLDNDRVERILDANRLRIKAFFNTPFENGTQPDVKFFDDYDVLIQLGVQAEILVEQDL